MRYIAAYLLATLGGKENPDFDTIKKILDSVGVSCDAENLKFVLKELHGKKIEDLIVEGSKKLSTLSLGGGGGAAAAAPTADAKGKPAEAKEAAKPAKEEKKEESEEEDMGFGLFD